MRLRNSDREIPKQRHIRLKVRLEAGPELLAYQAFTEHDIIQQFAWLISNPKSAFHNPTG
jgi:hypothetical protein